MSLLVGLPLKIFHMLFVILRLVWPVLLILLLLYLVHHKRQGAGHGAPRQEKPQEPTFDGPVYTVDYEEVDDEEA